MLENWCWTGEVIASLSEHYANKAPLPEQDLRSLIAAKNVNVALFSCRQLYFSIMDMIIHMDAPADLQALDDELRPTIALFENPSGTPCNY